MEATAPLFTLLVFMAPSDFHWTSTDDARSAPKAPAVPIDGISGAAQSTQQVPSRHGMQLAAVVGVLSVIALGFGLSSGLKSLRGSLLENGATTIVITEDGHFAPSQVTVHPGTILTIESKKTDPQVIKPKDPAAELFGMEVIFGTPFTYTVPENVVLQSYQYQSETLSPEEMLTITVTQAPQEQVSAPATPPSPPAADAPIDTQTPAPSEQARAPREEIAATTQPTDNTPVTISFGLSKVTPLSPTSSPTPSISSLPVNPHTVASIASKKQLETTKTITRKQSVAKKALHAAAMPESGSADWILFTLAITALGWTCKRALNVI